MPRGQRPKGTDPGPRLSEDVAVTCLRFCGSEARPQCLADAKQYVKESRASFLAAFCFYLGGAAI